MTIKYTDPSGQTRITDGDASIPDGTQMSAYSFLEKVELLDIADQLSFDGKKIREDFQLPQTGKHYMCRNIKFMNLNGVVVASPLGKSFDEVTL